MPSIMENVLVDHPAPATEPVASAKASWLGSYSHINCDPEQRIIARALTGLANELLHPVMRSSPLDPLVGLYIWGPPGGGKSMLMDRFFDSLSGSGIGKKRIHFHDFMQQIHSFIAQWRQNDKPKRRWPGTAKPDPIPPAARAMCQGVRVLCFDEFHVSDIADAMLLGRLFERIFADRITVIATSNLAPEELYKNGLNRDLFLPFIAMLQQHMRVLELRPGRDYRLKDGPAVNWYSPLGDASSNAMDTLWQRISAARPVTPVTLVIAGHELHIASACDGHARMSFDDLCKQALGAADYLALAEHFHTLMLDNVPILSQDQHDAAMRFVTLIDALYEAGTRLIIAADAMPEQLYRGSGEFFARAASRLHEMCWTQNMPDNSTS